MIVKSSKLCVPRGPETSCPTSQFVSKRTEVRLVPGFSPAVIQPSGNIQLMSVFRIIPLLFIHLKPENLVLTLWALQTL